MDASKLTITKIFDRTEKLEIPFFQRSYVWKEEQCIRVKVQKKKLEDH